MNETQLKYKVLKFIHETYPQYWVYKTNDRFTAGIPDLLICGPEGHLTAIELKRPGEDATKLQQYVIDKIKKAGGTAGVAHSIDEVKKMLDKINLGELKMVKLNNTGKEKSKSVFFIMPRSSPKSVMPNRGF